MGREMVHVHHWPLDEWGAAVPEIWVEVGGHEGEGSEHGGRRGAEGGAAGGRDYESLSLQSKGQWGRRAGGREGERGGGRS